jgi:alpha-N-arabinofuranosidase
MNKIIMDSSTMNITPRCQTIRRLAGLLLIAVLADAEASQPADNLIRNPSFESGDGDRPRGWRAQTWGGTGQFDYARIGHTGERSVMLASTEGADISWTIQVPAEPHTRYRLAGWIKSGNLEAGSGRGALFNVHNLQGVATPAVTGNTDWKRVEVEFDVDDVDSLQINCLFGGWGQSRGRAWFDDVELVALRKLPAPAATPPSIAIDGSQVKQPLPVEIYSQFIEHLGRCVYGGIWAEMLEDRKFWYPITANYAPYTSLRDSAFPVVGASPWEIVGPAENIRMSVNKPFVGKHTPQIKTAAIRQHDLGITQGKEYVGYAWIKSADRSRAQAQVSLSWAEGPNQRQTVSLGEVGDDYRKAPFRFTAGATTDKASLEFRVLSGIVLLGAISLMPADNIDGMRADTIALLKELKAPIYRWPGGNFVSGYDWRDGIGDRDRRPPRTNPAWTGVEHNDFGMHEFISFCRLVGAEPWITVNTGFGDAYSAAAQLEYCNGSTETHWGGRRAKNGEPKPFGVKYWGIGNEMFGPWQLGYMALNHYVLKQNWVVDKMREVDPNIRCISSGNAGSWSRGLLDRCAEHMDNIAEHFYCQERQGLMAHIRQIPDNIRAKAEFHRRARAELPNLKGKDIRIAMTEWNYWYGPHVFGELGTRYFLKDALGIAAGLHEYARNTDIIASAFYAQTVNVIGGIKTSRRNAAFETTGLVLKLYRHHFGQIPVATETTGLLDAQAAWTADRKTLTLGIVNANLAPAEVPLKLAGVRLTGAGNAWQIAASDPRAFNDPDEAPNRVKIESRPVAGVRDCLNLAPCSVTLFKLQAEAHSGQTASVPPALY